MIKIKRIRPRLLLAASYTNKANMDECALIYMLLLTVARDEGNNLGILIADGILEKCNTPVFKSVVLLKLMHTQSERRKCMLTS